VLHVLHLTPISRIKGLEASRPHYGSCQRIAQPIPSLLLSALSTQSYREQINRGLNQIAWIILTRIGNWEFEDHSFYLGRQGVTDHRPSPICNRTEVTGCDSTFDTRPQRDAPHFRSGRQTIDPIPDKEIQGRIDMLPAPRRHRRNKSVNG